MAKNQQRTEQQPELKPQSIEYVAAPRHILRVARTFSAKWGVDLRLMLAWSMIATAHGERSEGSNHFNLKHGSPPDYRRFTADGRNIFTVYSDSWDMAAMLARKSNDPLQYVATSTGVSPQTLAKLIETIDAEA